MKYTSLLEILNTNLLNDYISYTLVIRYLALEEILGYNVGGIDLYNHLIQYRQHDHLHTIDQFCDLFYSIKYNKRIVEPLVIGVQGIVIDGSHRLACAMILDIDEIPIVNVQQGAISLQNNIKWIKSFYNTQQSNMIIDKANELIEYYKRLSIDKIGKL